MFKVNRFHLFPFVRPKSLKSKFLLSVLPPVTLCFLCVSLVSGALFYFETKQDILDRYEQDAQIYIKALSQSLWNLENSVVASQVNSMLNHPDITGVKVVEGVYGNEFSAGEVPGMDQLSGYLVFATDIVFTPYHEEEIRSGELRRNRISHYSGSV